MNWTFIAVLGAIGFTAGVVRTWRRGQREFDTAVRDALSFSAGHVPGLPRDGKPLGWRDRRALRRIERGARLDVPEPVYDDTEEAS